MPVHAPVTPAAKAKKTRIAHFVLPDIKADSALLPDDKWILANLFDTTRRNKALRFEALAGAALGLATLGGLAATAVATVGSVAAGAAAAGVVLTAGAGLAAVAGMAALGGFLLARHFKKHGMQDFKEGMGKRYIKLKTDEMMRAWDARKAARRAQVAAEKAAPKADAPETQPPETKPSAQPPAQPSKTSGVVSKSGAATGAFSKWAVKRLAAKKPDDTPSIKELQAGKQKPPRP
jgi:hypothetical protein